MAGFLAVSIGFPTLLVVISTIIRFAKQAPVTSAVDFLGLILVFDAVLIGDTSQVLTHVTVNFDTETVRWFALGFMTVSFAIWYFCLFELEPRVTEYYLKKRVFPS